MLAIFSVELAALLRSWQGFKPAPTAIHLIELLVVELSFVLFDFVFCHNTSVIKQCYELLQMGTYFVPHKG